MVYFSKLSPTWFISPNYRKHGLFLQIIANMVYFSKLSQTWFISPNYRKHGLKLLGYTSTFLENGNI